MTNRTKELDRMPMYDPTDDESLWPDEGFAVIEHDEFKHPSDEDYMVNIGQFDEASEVEIPAEKEGYTYYIHGADGESWARDTWNSQMAE